jgi:hypothetical protein
VALTIRAEDERGRYIDSAVDSSNAILRLVAAGDSNDCVLLRFVDAFGDTTFNCLQFDIIESDLALLDRAAETARDKATIDQVRTLLGVCRKNSPHTYLKFYGD